MIATYLEPVLTPVPAIDLANAYEEALLDLTGKQPTAMGVAVLMAHCWLETGRTASCFNFNLKNQKAGSQYAGYYTLYRCNERLLQADGSYAYKWFSPEGPEEPKGKVIRKYTVPPGDPQCRFRAWKKLHDAVRGSLNFFMDPKWQPAFQLALAGKPGPYTRAIHERHYFTAELGPYERSMISLTATVLPVAEKAIAEPPPITDVALCRDWIECMQVEAPDWLARVAGIQALTAANMLDEALDASRRDRDREIRKDSDPTMPGVRLPDSEPPEVA